MASPLERVELIKCAGSPHYFLDRYGRIYDSLTRGWVPFHLWPAQFSALDAIHRSQLTCVLKARQVGLSWLCLGYALWSMLFRPVASVLVFSKRETEAAYLLSDERMRGMWRQLPDFIRTQSTDPDSATAWMISNGSVCRALPSNAGDSYTATFALIDEADLIPDLNRLMRSVKPTIDAGGKLVLLSRADKSKPSSEFKKTYTSARSGKSPWQAVFLPWNVHPDRGEEWYGEQRKDIMSRTGSLDDLHEQYPATDSEALAARTLDKRIPKQWLDACFREESPLPDLPGGCPAIPGLSIFRPPSSGHLYVIGADPAQGNPTSDESALTVLDLESGEQVAEYAGKIEMNPFADAIDKLGRWYNHASVMVLRGNHGHAVLLWLSHFSPLLLLPGSDGKPGWVESTLGNTRMYDATTEAFRHNETLLHSFTTYLQLSGIDGNTLAAPPGEHEDRADAYAAAIQGRLVVYGALAATRD